MVWGGIHLTMHPAPACPPAPSRFEKEHGPNKIQILCKFIPNIFMDGYSPALVEPLVDKIRATVGRGGTGGGGPRCVYVWDPPHTHGARVCVCVGGVQ